MQEKTPMAMDELLRQAHQAQIEKMLSVSVSSSSWGKMKTLCQAHSDRIVLSAGIHPCYIEDQDFARLEKQATDEQVVAIGESGLDYHYCRDEQTRQRQQASFARHIDLSVRLDKPLIVHSRDASEDTIAILRAEHAERGLGVMHCFTETLAMAKSALDLGFYVSFSGIITFKNATELREVCRYVPMDRLLIETDAPYLAPTPYRGKVNRPAWVVHVAEQVATTKGLCTEEVAQMARKNFYTLFPLAV